MEGAGFCLLGASPSTSQEFVHSLLLGETASRLSSYSLYVQVVLISILIDIWYIQNFVFSFEKVRVVKITPQISIIGCKNPPSKIYNSSFPLPFNTIWKVLGGAFLAKKKEKKKILNKTIEKKVCQNMLFSFFSDNLCFVETFELICIENQLVNFRKVMLLAKWYF